MSQPDLFPDADASPEALEKRRSIAAAEERGDLVPSCRRCVEWLYPHWPNSFAPAHRSRCGATYNHCTCDSCF